MAEYRRWYVPGGSYFFTVVTRDRAPIFREAAAVRVLGVAMRTVRGRYPFETAAAVLLPDHLHCLWNLPRGDHRFPLRWKQIKAEFTERWLEAGGTERPVTAGRMGRGERGIWQRRYWEHLIRDEDDLERHVEYIHYNPVRHGFMARPGEWPWSSFHRFVRLGRYGPDWGRPSRSRRAWSRRSRDPGVGWVSAAARPTSGRLLVGRGGGLRLR